MNTFLKLLLATFLTLISFVSQAASDLISPKDASVLSSEKKAVIIDVREDDEWKSEHIADAIHIPLNQLPSRLAELKGYKDKTIITQCRAGHRSLKALDVLKSAGFTNAYSMDGGLQAWDQQGLKTTK